MRAHTLTTATVTVGPFSATVFTKIGAHMEAFHCPSAGPDAVIIGLAYQRVTDWVPFGRFSAVAVIVAHPQRCDVCMDGCVCRFDDPWCGHKQCLGDRQAPVIGAPCDGGAVFNRADATR